MSPFPSTLQLDPLPETQWGIKNWNYVETEIAKDPNYAYAIHTPGVFCYSEFIPVGIFGFFVWYIQLLLNVYTFIKYKKGKQGEGFGTFFFRTLVCVYSAFNLYLNGKVVHGCRGYVLWAHHSRVMMAVSSITCLSSFGSILAVKSSFGAGLELVCTGIAILLQTVVDFIVLQIVMSQAMVKATGKRNFWFFDYMLHGNEVEGELERRVIVATIVTLGLSLGSFVLVLWYGLKWRWAVVILFIPVGLLFFGVSQPYIIMGKIIKDPEGRLFLRSLIGKVSLGLTIILPIVEFPLVFVN